MLTKFGLNFCSNFHFWLKLKFLSSLKVLTANTNIHHHHHQNKIFTLDHCPLNETWPLTPILLESVTENEPFYFKQ